MLSLFKSDKMYLRFIKNFFEPQFGYDFSQVLIHTEIQATETAKAVNTSAFTTDCYFLGLGVKI